MMKNMRHHTVVWAELNSYALSVCKILLFSKVSHENVTRFGK